MHTDFDDLDDVPEKRMGPSPAPAVLIGIVLAAVMTWLIIGYARQSFGAIVTYVLLVLGPVLPGFIVGLMARRDGDKWASLSAGVFVLSMAFHVASADAQGDPVSGFMMAVGLGVVGIGMAAIFGKLGEMASGLPTPHRRAASALVMLVMFGAPGAYWASVYAKVCHVRYRVLPVVQRRISEGVIELPNDTRWTIERVRIRLRGYSGVHTATSFRGHRLYVRVSPDGRYLFSCYCGYEPDRPVKLTDEDEAKDYLRELGVSDRIIERLDFGQQPALTGRSWFCPYSLVPNPARKPCTDHPSCGEDLSFIVFEDGSFRFGRYHRPWSHTQSSPGR